MTNEYIYLDHNATTPLDSRVLEAMLPYLTELYGNASSGHLMGRRIKVAVDWARGQVADMLDVNIEDIYFTAGATEAINIALRGLPNLHSKPAHIITSQAEHPAVLDTCRYLETTGVEVTYIPVDKYGLIDADAYKEAFRDNTILATVMLANNETGVVQLVDELAEMAHEHGALFMTDATQAAGKYAFTAGNVDMLVISAHKFYGPKGIGALYVNPRLKLNPLIYGGGHERGLRSGTLHVAGIVGMGKAAEIAHQEVRRDMVYMGRLRDMLEARLAMLGGVFINGMQAMRLTNTANLRFEDVDNEALMLNLKNICVSNGSACHAFTMEPSHVLLAMGLTKEEANSSIRFSLGKFNTMEEIDYTVEQVRSSLERLRAIGA